MRLRVTVCTVDLSLTKTMDFTLLNDLSVKIFLNYFDSFGGLIYYDTRRYMRDNTVFGFVVVTAKGGYKIYSVSYYFHLNSVYVNDC